MKKTVFLSVFIFIAAFAMAQQNEDMYQKARLLIYGENPVMTIAKFTDAELDLYNSYGLIEHAAFEGQRMLTWDGGASLLNLLCENEWERRHAKSRDEFFLYLQETKERVDKWPMDENSGKATAWLLVLNMAARTNQLPIGKR
jgi:hypothetical protein